MAAEDIPARLISACGAVRLARPADTVAGVQPSLVASPADTRECAGLLRTAAELGLGVVPRGTGARMHWGYPPERCDLVIEMTRMDQVVEHAAGDLVATVQAGVSLERLGEVLGAAGQRLALDPCPLRPAPPPATPPTPARHVPHQPAVRGAALPTATRGTVGGVLATGAAGPLRLRYGTARDLVLGITVVRPDGTIARSGGKVVKNVAGYDLGKLFAGSRGTLGLITQATFRLHPVPAEAAYVSARCAAAVDACQVLAEALGPAIAPVAAELHWPSADAPVQVCVALEGDQAGVAERAIDLAGLIGRDAEPSVHPKPPAWWGAGPAAQPDGTVLQISFWPGDLGLVLAEIRAAAGAAGLDPSVGGSAAAGVLLAGLPPEHDPGAIAAFVSVLRGALGHGLPAETGHRLVDVPLPPAHARAHGGAAATAEQAPAGPGQRRSGEGPPARATVVVQHAPPAVGAMLDLFGPMPSLPLMRSVKRQFDPSRMMSPGRFAGRI